MPGGTSRFEYNGRWWFAMRVRGKTGPARLVVAPVGGSGLPAPSPDECREARKFYEKTHSIGKSKRLLATARAFLAP